MTKLRDAVSISQQALIIPEEIKLEFVWGRSPCTYRRNRELDDKEIGKIELNKLG